jgi:hypothetical protein
MLQLKNKNGFPNHDEQPMHLSHDATMAFGAPMDHVCHRQIIKTLEK